MASARADQRVSNMRLTVDRPSLELFHQNFPRCGEAEKKEYSP